MLNPFFLQGSRAEQGLIQDLINEQLRMYGVEVHYLPRQFITEKTVIREVIESEFNNAYPIEAYVDTYEGYSDNPTILSKFGIQALNEITLTISRERFKNYISPLIQNQQNIKVSSRPKEGDIIYFPLGRRLFEVKYVEHEKPFYQLQGSYTYQLRCELFRYEDEVIDTSIDEIDDLIGGNDSTDPDKVIFHSLGHWRMTPGFHDVLWNPAFVMAAYQLLGNKDVRFWHDQLFCKPAKHGGVVAWHQDYSYWTRSTPMQHLTAWIGLDDASEENGCLQYIPKSQNWGLLDKPVLTGNMNDHKA